MLSRNLKLREQGAESPEPGRWLHALEGQNRAIELISKGAPLDLTLNRLAQICDELFAAGRCFISVIDPAEGGLEFKAGPSLETAVEAAIRAITADAGPSPCSTALAHGEPMIVGEIASDPIWNSALGMLRNQGIRSYWAHPVLSRDGDALGTLSIISKRAGLPSKDDCRIIDTLCVPARIALEQKRHAHALALADQRFKSLANCLPGVVYQRQVTPDGQIRYTYISEGARDLFGVSPEEILADPQALFDCHGPEYREGFRERLIAASKELKIWDVEASIITRSGEHKWTHAIAKPQRQADGSVLWSGVILDATRLKEANLQLEALNRAKTEFIANVSHELRTPLNAIIGFSEVLCNELYGPLANERYEQYASDVLNSGHHLLRIINEILDIAKIDAGHMELEEEPIDVSDTVEGAVKLAGAREANSQVKVTVQPTELPLRLLADQRKVKQILINILSNALKFTPDGGRVTIAAAMHPGGAIEIAVSDTGIGIGEGDLEKIFRPFEQVECGLSRKFGGTGLGLHLTKSLVELHGGELTLASRLGEGTTVTVRFPKERTLP